MSLDKESKLKVKVETVLSEEDSRLKERIEEMVSILLDKSSSESMMSETIERLKREVKTSTTTMTSVPKPFKFIKEYYPRLVEQYK